MLFLAVSGTGVLRKKIWGVHTSPLYNGEISICNIYRGVDFAVVQQRGFDL